MHTRFLSTAEYPLWTDFLAEDHIVAPFSGVAYAESVAQHLGFPFKILVTEDKGKIQAGILLFEKKKLGISMAVTPPMTPYSGIILSTAASQTTIFAKNHFPSQLVSEIGKLYAKSSLVQYPYLQDSRFFQWNNWLVQPKYTYWQTPSTFEEIYNRLPQDRRYDVRRAAKSYEFKPFEPAQTMAKLVEQSYKRQQKSVPISTQTLTDFLADLKDKKLVNFYGISLKGEENFQAAVAVVQEKATAYHFLAGSAVKNANLFLNMCILDQMHKMGIEVYDFCGANIPSIAKFKALTQPNLAPYFQTLHYQKGWLKRLDALR